MLFLIVSSDWEWLSGLLSEYLFLIESSALAMVAVVTKVFVSDWGLSPSSGCCGYQGIYFWLSPQPWQWLLWLLGYFFSNWVLRVTVVAVVTALPVFHVTVVEGSPFQGYHGDRPFVCVLSFKDQARPGSWRGGGRRLQRSFSLSFSYIGFVCYQMKSNFMVYRTICSTWWTRDPCPPSHTHPLTPLPPPTHTHTHVRLWFQWSSSRHSLLNAHQTWNVSDWRLLSGSVKR